MYGTYKDFKSVKELKEGDIILHKGNTSGPAYIVTGCYGNRVTAVRTVDVTNPGEWMVLKLNQNQARLNVTVKTIPQIRK